MVKNLKRYRKSLERESGRLEATKCDFFPRTFELPSEYHLFVEEFKRSPGSTWIMKPVSSTAGTYDESHVMTRKLEECCANSVCERFGLTITLLCCQVARSQGKGIFLFRKLKDIMDWKKVNFFYEHSCNVCESC